MTFLPLIEIILVEPAVCILRCLISHCGWFHPHNILGWHTGNKCAMSRQWPHSGFLSDHPISPLVVGNGPWSHEYEESMTNVIIKLKLLVQIYWGQKYYFPPVACIWGEKIAFSCLQQAEERNFFTSFSQNLGFVDLPIPVYHDLRERVWTKSKFCRCHVYHAPLSPLTRSMVRTIPFSKNSKESLMVHPLWRSSLLQMSLLSVENNTNKYPRRSSISKSYR